ncbi:MAG TPA: hypothetical protein VGJ61_07625 [Solirubrobacterales bacterium]
MDELTEQTRREARAMSRRQRAEARRAVRPQADLGVRLRGAALETRRRLRPVFRPVAALFGWLGPYITRTLLFVIQLIGALIALVLEIGLLVIRWVGARLVDGAIVTGDLVRRNVRPLPTVAFVGIAAAVGLGASQFFDYHGVEVDAPGYAGKLGAEVPAPMTATETAGSAHLWILLPLAAVALLLIVATARGRPRLAGAVSVCGVLGIAVALAIDLPQGLDAGRAGLAFSGAKAELLQGFWAEVASSAVLIMCGGLLALYSRDVAGERRRRRRPRRGAEPSRGSHPEAGGIPPGLQAES